MATPTRSQHAMLPPPARAAQSNAIELMDGRGRSTGYTSNHANYDFQRHEAMRRTMISSGAQFITVKVELCRIIPSHKRPMMICVR